MKKIIFILSSIQDTHALKRIDEFKENGYIYETYGFVRNKGTSPAIRFTSLGKIKNGSSYIKRIRMISSEIFKVIKKHKNDNVIYYCFGFDIAIFVYLSSKKPFIYESADLMYTYFHSTILKNICKLLDRWLIKKSLFTVLSSEGFLDYLNIRKNDKIFIIPNKLNSSIRLLKHTESNDCNDQIKDRKIIITFCGMFRYKPLVNFAKVVAESFPNYSLRIHGIIADFDQQYSEMIESIRKSNNVQIFSEFKNPDDLPGIYSETDLVLCTYDTTFENVKYAEPNKLYEAIYFNKPIIVSSGTFLGKKVSALNIGYAIDASDFKSIQHFLSNISLESIQEKRVACKKIPKSSCINSNFDFFDKIHCFFNNI